MVVSHRSTPEVITSASREALPADEEPALAAELRFADSSRYRDTAPAVAADLIEEIPADPT